MKNHTQSAVSFDWVFNFLADGFYKVKEADPYMDGRRRMYAECPAFDHGKESGKPFCVNETKSGGVNLKCEAGCDTSDLWQALGVSMPGRKRAGNIVDINNPGGLDLTGDFQLKEVSWLVENVLPRGKYSLLVGRSGIGKSTMALWLAARLSADQSILDSPRPSGEGCKVLIHTTEDDWRDTAAVRLKLMGANSDKIGRLHSLSEGRNFPFDWTIDEEVIALQHHIQAQRYDLLIIDPVIDLIGTSSNNDPATIRRAIAYKINPILETGCAVLGVHHERKDTKRNEQLVDRALGSQAWTAAARTVLHMQAVPKSKAKDRADVTKYDLGSNSNQYGVLVVAKSNIAKVDGGWHYENPIQSYADQEAQHPSVAVRSNKITGIAPEALIDRYNPIGEREKSAVEKKAERDLEGDIKADERAEIAIKDLFKTRDRIPSKELQTSVQELAPCGETYAKTAIAKLCNKAVKEGNQWVRTLKRLEDA